MVEKQPRLSIVGGGPAGLMAAEVASAAGVAVDLYEGKGSVGRKFLIAGKGGLNLTHSEPRELFVRRYYSQQSNVSKWLEACDADALREWARGLGVETFVGTSGRIFPSDLKAAPLLRAWVRRLRSQGVRFHAHHYCTGLEYDRSLHFRTANGDQTIQSDAIVFALGGASWPQLGSDGKWVGWLKSCGVDIAALQPANCGFDVGWSDVFANRFAGQPVKSVAASLQKNSIGQQGEFVVTATGIEGSLIYALSAGLRDAILADAQAEIYLDLAPHLEPQQLAQKLAQPRNRRSLTEHLRRVVGIDGVKMGLLYETLSKETLNDPQLLAASIKSLRLVVKQARPIAEAISTAGGVRIEALSEQLMVSSMPGVFCAGEMLDWEAPTGGYLLTACFASGRVAGCGAVEWLREGR